MLRIGGAILCLAGLTFYGFNMNNPNPVRWALLSIVVAFGVLTWRSCAVSATVLAFWSYAALSLLWSPDWREGLLSLYHLTIALGLFLTVLHMDRKWLGRAIPIVASCAVAISTIGHIAWPESIGFMGNENFQAEFLCLLIPFCLIGRVTWPETMIGAFCLMMAALGAVMLFMVNPSDSKWAGIAGLAMLTLLMLVRRVHLLGLTLLLIGGSVSLWVLAGQRVLTSIAQRIELGFNTLLMWLDRPLFGSGLGGFNYLYPQYQEAHVGLIDSRSLHGVWLFAGATHNEYIQALAVFGLVGCALIAAFLWLALKQRASDPLANWSLISLSVLAGLSAVNFPLQNPSTAAIGAVALALALKPGEQIDLAKVSRLVARLRLRVGWRQVHSG
jgi:O-antigen ligase